MTTIAQPENKRGILVMDMGTSGLRTSLYDLVGNRIEIVGRRYHWSLSVTADGGAELDPNIVFWTAVKAVDETLKQCSARKWEIVALASCTLCPTLV